jgi:hypothetical protein
MTTDIATRKTSLFDIASEILAIGETLANADTPEEFDRALAILDSLEMSLSRKAENVVKYLRHLDAQVDAAKREEERMRAWRKSRENAIEKLRERLRDAMEVTGTLKVEWTGGRVTLVRPKTARLVTDAAMLPDEFIEEKHVVTRIPLKEKIEAAMETGAIVPGASYVFNRPHILVK